HGDTRADFWKADARHGSSRGEGRRAAKLPGQMQEQRRGARTWIALSRVTPNTPLVAAELPAGNAADHAAGHASKVSQLTFLRDAFQDHFLPFSEIFGHGPRPCYRALTRASRENSLILMRY